MNKLKDILLEKCILGVSGGADSMCMLHKVLNQIDDKNNILVIHVNHNLRGDESNQDEEFVKKFCEDNGVRCIVESIDVKSYAKNNHLSLEEAARILRYNIFYKNKENFNAKYILVAHNKNDNVETFLHNLIRGSGILGLRGMDYVKDDIIRPLIKMSRREIEDYNEKNQVSFRNDSTNYEIDYTRNKIRNIIIPLITREINSAFIDHVSSTIEFIKSENEIIADIVNKESERIKTFSYGCKIDLTEVRNDFLISEIIRLAIKNLFGLKDIGKVHIDKIVEVSKSNKNIKINLPNNWIARRCIDGVEIIQSDYIFEENLNNAIEKKLIFNGFKFIITTDNKNALCYDRLKEAKIRNRQNGDYIITSKRVKLKDFLIKKKIHPLKRDELLVIALGNRIVWVEGLFFDYNFKALGEKGVKIERND